MLKSPILLFVILLIVGCNKADTDNTHGKGDSHHSQDHQHSLEENTEGLTKETFSLKELKDEIKNVPDSIMQYLHSQHHAHKMLERRTVDPGYETKEPKYWSDYLAKVEDLPAINPGPGEYVHVMEGYKHGYKNLVIGITETFPGGAPPMHTHKGEEAHVLLEGTILYALGDTIFTVEAPYIVNIPPMVPHAFKNIGEETANLVVIFPTNVWEYDVLDYFPFKEEEENN